MLNRAQILTLDKFTNMLYNFSCRTGVQVRLKISQCDPKQEKIYQTPLNRIITA
jgi:hypothetical protein